MTTTPGIPFRKGGEDVNQNLPGRRVKPGYTIERQPKPTALRLLLVLIGVAAPVWVLWDLSTAADGEVKAAYPWPLYILIGSLFVAYWFISKANENDMIEKSNDASYPYGEIVDEDPKDIA